MTKSNFEHDTRPLIGQISVPLELTPDRKTVRICAEMRPQACSSLLCSSSGLIVTTRIENKRPVIFFRPALSGQNSK